MKLDRNRELYERAKRVLAGGVSSQVRISEQPLPLFFERGEGSRLYDVDGNEYIDYVIGQGPAIFGHSPRFLLDAVADATRQGQTFGGQHELEVRVAETVQEMVASAELIRFGSSGSEVVHAALRLARAYTGRGKFIKFEGHYHGWLDSVLYSTAPSVEAAGAYDAPEAVPGSAGQSPGSAGEVVVLPWNDIDVLRATLDGQGKEVAAIITEPIMCNSNCIAPRTGYLEEMRKLCDQWGIVLIFDEVITGFRLAPGGAQGLLGVTPDLSTFAKAMAGGFPISMLAGKREVMGQLEEGTAMHAGTYNSNVMVMAAAEASLRRLTEDGGAVYRHLYATGQTLMDGLRETARKHELNALVQGYGPVFCMAFSDASEITDYRSHVESTDRGTYARFRQGMLERGVRVTDRGTWFVSAAHTEADVEQTLVAADEAMEGL